MSFISKDNKMMRFLKNIFEKVNGGIFYVLFIKANLKLDLNFFSEF